jgi:hypothetical protein
MTLSYVIIVPVFLIGIMTMVQASIWYLARESVLAAARHGADVARTSQPPPGSGAQAAVSFATSATSTFLSNVTASARGTTATTVRITVSARIPSMVPGLPIRVTEVVTAPVERFVALGDSAFLPGRGVTAPGSQRCRCQQPRYNTRGAAVLPQRHQEGNGVVAPPLDYDISGATMLLASAATPRKQTHE